MLNDKIDRDSELHGKSKDNLYIQIRDHLDAARVAYLVRLQLHVSMLHQEGNTVKKLS